MQKIDDWHEVSRLEDLTPAIELYYTLIGLGQYEDAYVVFRDRLDQATHYRLSASRQRIELLELLFPDGIEQLPRLRKPDAQAFALNVLSIGYYFSGQPQRATSLLRHVNTIYSEMKRDDWLSIGLCNLSHSLRQAGKLCAAEFVTRRAIINTRIRRDHSWEAVSLREFGLKLAVEGRAHESELVLQRSLRMFIAQSNDQSVGVTNAGLAQRALWCNVRTVARVYADCAWEFAYAQKVEGDFIRAARMQGTAALRLSDFAAADERLHHALTRALQVNHVEEELPALIALAELRRQQGQPDEARAYLSAVWSGAERGPYPLEHVDALNVLAQLERDAGNTKAAIEAATKAYRLAWCDGPPYAYHWGLIAAQKHLAELGAPVPALPPFDPSKFEPMPEVEINPKDEFYVEVDTQENGR